MSKHTSYGTCTLCSKRTTKAGMSHHLAQCLADHEPSGGKASRLFRLRIEDAFTPFYWMDVEMKSSDTLALLDTFLRQRWLECCGHLSSFTIGRTEYTVPVEMMDIMGFESRTMDVKLADVLSKGTSFGHVYDFGTATELKLRVAD